MAADRIVIAYGEGGVPSFTVEQMVCNLTPATADEVFYRKVLSISDDAPSKRLTLFTEDVTLERFIQQGAISISLDSEAYEVGGNGSLVRGFDMAGEIGFTPIGPDLSRETLWSSGGASLRLTEARWQLTPVARVSVEVEGFDSNASKLVCTGTSAPRWFPPSIIREVPAFPLPSRSQAPGASRILVRWGSSRYGWI